MKQNKIIIIGDVHRKINEYYKILEKYKNNNSIQVGDFGFKEEHEWHLKNLDFNKHKINFGNHDDYTFLNNKHSLGDFSYIEEYKLMTVRGAMSKDKALRYENIDWWSNEELNYNEMQNAIDFYVQKKPKVMITHDCPQKVKEHLFNYTNKSITSNGLQTMLELHQPELWIFGHCHKSKNEVINGTRFICLSELETLILYSKFYYYG